MDLLVLLAQMCADPRHSWVKAHFVIVTDSILGNHICLTEVREISAECSESTQAPPTPGRRTARRPRNELSPS